MKWEDLSMKDRTAIMAAAVRNGYTDIRSIKEAYANYLNQKLSTGNRYAEGGSKDNSQQESSMKNYTTWRMLLNTRKNIDPNDNTFDYEGYYNEDPDRAWNMLNEDVNAHFEDKWKTVYHPTFSTLSFYSGLGHPVHNPSGAIGGTWGNNGQFETYTVSDDQYRGPVSMNNRIDYLIDNSSDGVQLLESDGSLPYMENNTFLGPILPNITVTNKNAYGGNLFERGGDVKGIKGFFNLLKKHGIKVIETSGYRKGAVTKSGHASFHSMLDEWGNAKAQDFKPADGDWDKLRQRIYRNPELVQYMLDNNIGILEENTPEAQKRYGTRSKDGKGVWHAGYDTAAKRDRDNNIKLLQATYHPMQDITWADVKARKKQFELTPEEERLANTPTQTVFEPEYEDRNHPNYKESPLAESVKLNDALYNEPSPMEKLGLLYSLLNGSSQDNTIDLLTTLMALSPKATPQLKENANTLNWLFAPKDNDYMYHGLNFAAYGGPLVRTANNMFYDGGFSNLPEQRAAVRAINLKAPYNNYEDAVDMEDSAALQVKKFFDKGVSNCTLTASQILNPNRPIGRARTITTDPIGNGYYEVDEDHIVPGTMVIASYPVISDYNPDLTYHSMVVTGFAKEDQDYVFRDGTVYHIKKGEPLVSYSRGKASADNYVHDIPLSVYNDKSEGKTYNRYYRPIDERYPLVMMDGVEVVANKKANGGRLFASGGYIFDRLK